MSQWSEETLILLHFLGEGSMKSNMLGICWSSTGTQWTFITATTEAQRLSAWTVRCCFQVGIHLSRNWISRTTIYTVVATCIARNPHLRWRHSWRSLASAFSIAGSERFLFFVLTSFITHRTRIKIMMVFWRMGLSTKNGSGLLADRGRISEQPLRIHH